MLQNVWYGHSPDFSRLPVCRDRSAFSRLLRARWRSKASSGPGCDFRVTHATPRILDLRQGAQTTPVAGNISSWPHPNGCRGDACAATLSIPPLRDVSSVALARPLLRCVRGGALSRPPVCNVCSAAIARLLSRYGRGGAMSRPPPYNVSSVAPAQHLLFLVGGCALSRPPLCNVCSVELARHLRRYGRRVAL